MTGRKPPVKAAVAPALREKLTSCGLDPEILQADFIDWKSGDEDGSYFFARDGLNRDSKYLAHAHILPTIQDALDKWNSAWSKHRKRTSDRYLFYVDGGLLFGYLLLDIVDDPGAHHVWKSEPARVKALEQAAEQFFMSGRMPTPKN